MTGTVLIVDDDLALTQALALRLRHSGYEVHAANDATTATVLVQRERPDVVILDIDMPHFSGPEFHECLHITDRTRKIPVVYLSGHDCPMRRRSALESGARAFVSKPYDFGVLLGILRSLTPKSDGTCPDEPAAAQLPAGAAPSAR